MRLLGSSGHSMGKLCVLAADYAFRVSGEGGRKGKLPRCHLCWISVVVVPRPVVCPSGKGGEGVRGAQEEMIAM